MTTRPGPVNEMNEAITLAMRVRDWNRLYENNRSRKMKNTHWFPVPNDLSADSYVELLDHPEGPAHLGVWTGVLMVASRAKPRGSLVREDGRPHDTESLARVMRQPEALVRAAVDRLIEIGVLETGANKPRRKSNLRAHSGARKPQDPAKKAQEGDIEQKGTEHHHQEGNRTEKKRTGRERKGRERAPDESPTEHSVAPEGFPKNPSHEGDDDPDEVRYASPEAELKAIYLTKAGEPITISLLDAIRVNLETTGVSMADFAAEVKKHFRGDWRNPPGFLRDLSKRFRSKTRPAAAPVTAEEAEARDYQCQLCHSRVPRQGAILRGGQSLPCACAGLEWIAEMRARGVFPPEDDQ
jgi:hypothetical protein